ncbi:MAG: COG1470 family protein, partial [Candidatus Helarchaeota archaeon]
YEKVDATLEILETYSLIALCHIVQGEFQEGRVLLQKKVAKSKFPQIKKSRIIQFAVLIINTILTKKTENLEEIAYQISKMKLGKGILNLFKLVQDVTTQYVDTIITITPDKQEIRAGDEIEVKIEVKRPLDLKIVKSQLSYDRIFDLVKDKTIENNNRLIRFRLRPRIQGNLKIGPIVLICKTSTFQFPLKVQKTIHVLPGLPELIIRTDQSELSTVIGNAVPITLILMNQGKGECMNLNLQLTLPEEIELVEGSLEKKLHSLGPQEEFSFTFRIMANAKVEASLFVKLNYEDLEAKIYSIDLEPIRFIAES